MNTAVFLLAAVILLAVTGTILQKYSPVLAVVFSLAAAAWVLLRAGQAVQQVLQGAVQLGQRTDGQAFSCLLRSAGLLLLTDYARTLCEEAGADSLAWCAGLAGRCLVLAAVWPLLREVCQTIWGLAG